VGVTRFTNVWHFMFSPQSASVSHAAGRHVSKAIDSQTLSQLDVSPGVHGPKQLSET
jgi:hypothetical protein